MSGYARRRRSAQSGQRQHHPSETKWRHSKKFWSVITAIAILIGTALATGVGQSIYSAVVPGGDVSRIRNPIGQPPVQLDAVSVNRVADTGTYVFPDALNLSANDLEYLDQLELHGGEYDKWMRAHDGVDPLETDIRVTVEGNRNHPVQITDAVIAEKKCTAPLRGTYLFSPGAGQVDVVRMGFNLDTARPKAQKYDGYKLSGNYFATHNISLGPGEQQTLIFSAKTDKYYCEFSIQLIVVDGNKSFSIPVRNPDGKDGVFKVTADLVRWNEEFDGDFSEYEQVYIRGVASNASGWRRVDPSTYKGHD
ncbi:hypothetical protein ACWDUC_37595 [Streptomyces tricolor]